ncbi:peptidoglycan recognition protein [Streptomyces laurentii]|uniref:peptidoglycan recognition protein family protein n=1 Tax=Streptomyces laurentii TaxID=39478 RepID=UPI00368EB77F
MRASLVSSIAVGCAAALALPLSLTTPAAAAPVPALAGAASDAGLADLAGSTQSLPLEPLAPDGPRERAGGRAAPDERGLTRREVRPFSLVGVVWDDARTPLHGTVQVRTRATADGAWSRWQDVETHYDEHGADPGTTEDRAAAPRGATAPLWVGDSDGVEVRVRPERGETEETGRTAGPDGVDRTAGPDGVGRTAGTEKAGETAGELPAGLRLELVDPGREPAGAPSDRVLAAPAADGADGGEAAPMSYIQLTDPYTSSTTLSELSEQAGEKAAVAAEQAAESAAANADLAPYGTSAIPALSQAQTLASLPEAATAKAKPYIGARPKIVTRKGWGADEGLREGGFVYTKTVKAAFVHHSATGNNYTCGDAPAVLRGIYRYHVKSLRWRDLGYNFAVDKCGSIYEGRAGGVAKAVQGAHTMGFNGNSMGIAVLGTYGSANPPAAAVTAIARLTAWKLGLFGANPKSKTTLTSGGGNRFKKGTKVKLNVISGHRDGFATECPGKRLYGKLGTARSASAKYQGRH